METSNRERKTEEVKVIFMYCQCGTRYAREFWQEVKNQNCFLCSGPLIEARARANTNEEV